MSEIKKVIITTTFVQTWWRGNGPVKKEHLDALQESGAERINEMIKEGYSSGELSQSIRMDGSDGPDGIQYTGWWNAKTTQETSP